MTKYVPTAEHPFEFYLEHAHTRGPVFRYNNVWGYYEFLNEDGTWAGANPNEVDWDEVASQDCLQYFDDSYEFCRED